MNGQLRLTSGLWWTPQRWYSGHCEHDTPVHALHTSATADAIVGRSEPGARAYWREIKGDAIVACWLSGEHHAW